jgi:hypothetical protein
VKFVLDLLFKFAPGLPLKFFVTSRPAPEIYSKMVAQSQSSRTVLHLHEIENSLVEADIELYLRDELSFMSPTENEVKLLAGRSGNLFIYAATLVRYIRPANSSINPEKRMQSLLTMTQTSMKKHAEIDALYAIVLKSALDADDLESEEAEDVRLVLHTALCTQEPVTVETLATLAGFENGQRALSALQPLRSVLHISESSRLVSILHASFPDFMFSKQRAQAFFCDVAEHNRLIAQRCFEVMKEQLRFNICNLESSYVPDERVKDLKSQINTCISPILSYACRYWADHLRLTRSSDELCALLNEFLSIGLLFWMEVMNLKGEIGVGIEILVKAKVWLQVSQSFPAIQPGVTQMAGYIRSEVHCPSRCNLPRMHRALS